MTQAEVVQVRGLTFIGKATSNHWVPMDGPADFQGSDSGARPKELMLIALGGCTGSDVASILHKMRENISRFKIDIVAEVAKEHPKVFTSIRLTYKFWGKDLKPANIEKAITLSQERYCSVSAMLRKAVEINCSHQINPAED